MSVRATLAGIPLTADQDLSWALTEGVQPFQRVFTTDAAGARAIMRAAPGPVDFVVEATGLPTLTVKGLCILSLKPGDSPNNLGVFVTDRRWHWAHKAVARDYNLRRRTGDTRLVGENNVRVENQTTVADVAYAPWSVNNGAPWTADAALRDLFETLEPGNVTIEPLVRNVQVEDWTLPTTGDAAAAALLELCGGLGVTVDETGKVRIFDRRNRSEVARIANAGPILQGTGFVAEIDRSGARPVEVDIYYERECELRFDFDEDAAPTLTSIRGEEPLALENVAPSSDSTLEVGGRVVTQGTWCPIDDLLAAWRSTGATNTAPTPARASSSVGPLSQALVREHYFHWSNLEAPFVGVEDFEFNGLWQRRLRSIWNHWRKTYRILPEWRDRIRNIKPIRVGIVDSETGTPAKALAWMDFVVLPTKFTAPAGYIPRNPTLGRNISAYAATLAAENASPAEVRMSDDQAGVFRVVLQPDPFGETDSMAPGNADKLPAARRMDTRQTMSTTARAIAIETSKLVSGFKLSVVLTAIQGAPNNLGRFHVETVTPGAAEKVLGKKIGACRGPKWSVLVSGNSVPARFMWSDDRATEIKAAFFKGTPYPASLLVNKSQVRNVATAEAARLYGSLLDRTEGSFAVALNPSLRVTGAIRAIEHRVDSLGRCATLVTIDPEIEPVDIHSLLPASDQRALRRMVTL